MPVFHQRKSIHPLVAVAAASLTVFSLLGIAAITGILPLSRSAPTEVVREAPQAFVPPGAPVLAANNDAATQPVSKPAHAKPVVQAHPQQTSVAVNDSVQHKPVPSAPAVAAQPAPPQNSPVGIGVGAVVGGLVGNQVGQGSGKTVATILGALGGGYLGNEIAKKNQ
jgi:uncharacterized protein YcfJ